MILSRIIRTDLMRKKGAMLVVFAFIMLSSLLLSSGSNLIVVLNNSLDSLFKSAAMPHFVQMHSGALDAGKLEAWVRNTRPGAKLQTVEMITIDGSTLYLGGNERPEENSIMDVSFVRQNDEFDFLLDLENRILALSPGEIGVPIYYAEQRGVAVGDRIRIADEGREYSYTVAALVRDAQMNPAIVHSKRFLLSDSDYRDLRQAINEIEYLIEVRLPEPEEVDKFSTAYLAAGMPQQGPTVDYRLFKTLNAVSDGLVAGVIILLSLLLMLIALLCLRFTILAAVEEDYREIGVMKAIGMTQGKIRGIYLIKYIFIAGTAALTGYLISLAVDRLVTANIMLYIGRAPRSPLQLALPVIAATGVFLAVIVSSRLVLRRFKRISAVEALRAGARTETTHGRWAIPLSINKLLNLNIFLGLRDIAMRFKLFALLFFIFFFAAFITIIPVHFLSTITSPGFIAYMGIGRSDIRIDLRQSETVGERFSAMIADIEADRDVARFTPLVTSQFTLVHENGETETMAIETGDFSLFPLDYLKGRAPQNEDEIALSLLNSRDLEKGVDDTLILRIDGREQAMRICGIYQDVTNGGRTAKAGLPQSGGNVLWYTLSLDLTDKTLIADKVGQYSERFHPARVTDMESYLSQTLGNTIAQLEKVTLAAVAVGLGVAILITSLFLRMLISKDARRIAIMKSLGFSLSAIRLQYLTTSIGLLSLGIGAGTLFANTAGQRLISALVSFMGAAQISFVIDPLKTYLLLPILLGFAVGVTTVVSITGIKEHTISAAVAE